MKNEYLLFWIIPISQVLMIAGSFELQESGTLGNIGILLSVIADVILTYVVFHSIKKEKVEKELENVRYLKELERERNELLDKKNQDIYALRKDFESRVQTILSELKAGNLQLAQKDIDRLQEKLDASKIVRYCSNPVANAILMEKEKECQKLGFSLEADVAIQENCIVEPLHMCSILSNVLDNAIEAVNEMPLEKREIIIQTERKGSYLFIKTKNPTTKKYALRPKRKNRGYGNRILSETVEKYNGKYEGIYKEGFYISTVMIKVV